MASYNKVLLMGNLTRDPELRFTASNQPVAQIGLAVNRHYTSSTGEKKEEVTFVDCEAWGRTAELINQYFSKGRPIFIEGRLKLDQWEDQQGQKRSRHKVVIESFQFVDSRGGGGGEGGGERSEPRSAGGPRPARAAGGGDSSGAHQPIEEEDIPF
ncbi:MAG: single-stranded DNA-binding protein [Phycisphaerales bacterium]|nr:single-stranded DNA-binding protein [Phycisphaerales bacterium]